MAEIEIYDSFKNKLTPKRIFSSESNVLNEMLGNKIQQMFDGNVLTFYTNYTKKSTWIGVEFENPVSISQISFLPRNDDNFIREDEIYQLYYWCKDEWHLLQTMKGKKDGILTVNNVPQNALLLLHNATKGKEDRIFTYENDNQVWW